MRYVQLDVELPDNGWSRVGQVAEGEPAGSFSDHGDGRNVYVFGWLEGVGPGVWRSVGGVDVETPEFRSVHSLGFERVADLTVGPFEMQLSLARGPQRVRFSTGESEP
jgi:hypothetical protein